MRNINKTGKMDNVAKISVIIPIYNTDAYLRECLDSVVGQSLAELEIICVDDGSNDNSSSILKEYAEKDERISIYTQENQGVSIARNNGIKHATGEYLYFFDSDDILEENVLEKIYNTAKERKLEVLYFDGSSFSNSEECKEIAYKYHDYYTRKNEYPEVTTGPQMLVAMLQNEEYRVAPVLCLVEREYALKCHLYFPSGIVQEDNYFTYCCILNAKRAGYMKVSCYKRRIREGSIMTKKPAFKNAYGYFIVHLKMREFLEQLQLSNEEERAASDIIYRNFRSAEKIFEQLDDFEKEMVNTLPEQERILFKAYIVNHVELKNKYEKDEEKILLKLQKIEQKSKFEKEEFQKKLKKTYEEKSEINAKLQKTYQEKSEINAKLQKTYQEKFERGVEIKQLKEKLKNYEKQIEELSKNPGVKLAHFFKS